MKPSKNNFRFFAASLGITSPLWIISAASAQTYSVTDLGTIGGTYDSSIALSINNSGQIVGSSFNSVNYDTSRAFEYSGGVMTDLSPVVGGTNSGASGINNAGTIVGYADSQAFIDTGGSVTYLNAPAGGYNGIFANAVNSSGQVACEAYTYVGGQYRPYEAFLYSGGTLNDLGNLGGNSQALAINDSGVVVGDSDVAGGGQHAFIYSGSGPMKDLGTIAGSDGLYSYASAINNAGLITGASDAPNNAYDAFLYDGTTMNDLGNLGGGYSEGLGINNLGQIVGDSYTAGGADDAFLYSGGVMTDLNSLIPADSGWQLTAAYGIDDAGDIVGYGINPSGQLDAFELSVPEPASSSLLCIGALALLRRRRRTQQ